MSQQPNIVFFLTDDQRFDTIGGLNNPAVRTPNMDALAARGVTFTHAHIPGGNQGAVCMPSRAMLHTGRRLFSLESDGAAIPDGHTLLGELLQAAGYQTWGTGKWHNGTASFNRSFRDGDEIMFGGMGDHWNVPAFHYDPTGGYTPSLPVVQDPLRSRDVVMRNADHMTPGTHSTELFCDAAVDYLERCAANDPFFMYISFMAPHDPRTMPGRFLEMYDPSDIELPANFMVEHPFDFGVHQIRDEVLAETPRDPEEIKRHLAEYYAMITHLDYEMGRVMAKLKATGQWDNTIIVFAGDNGLALGQHGLLGKQSSYDHSVRVPLMMSGPGLPPGETRDQCCYLLDIYPTLCDLLDLETPASVEGQSLLPVIQDAAGAHREEMYFVYGAFVRACRVGDEKLIEYVAPGCRETQLFNLADDPCEMNSLADDQPERVEAMRDTLLRLRDAWDDRGYPTSDAFWGGYTV